MPFTLPCDLHDHFEHVCVLQLPVRLALRDGREIDGRAVDLIRLNGKEALQLSASSGADQILLADIKSLHYPEPGADNQTPWRAIKVQP